MIGLLGLATLAYGIMLTGEVKLDAEVTGDFTMPSASGYGWLIVLCGVVAIITSMLGCLTAMKKNPCFAIPFGILTCIIGLVLCGIAMAVFGMMTGEGRKMIDEK